MSGASPIRVVTATIDGRIFAGRPTKDGRGLKEPRYDVTGDVLKAIHDKIGMGHEIDVGLAGTGVMFRIAILPPQSAVAVSSGETFHRDEQGGRTYANGIADAAKVADQEADDIKQHAHLASDAWQQGREAMARTIATAIRRLSIEQGDQDGGEG